MKSAMRAAIVAVLAICTASSQPAAVFEVASVKRAEPGAQSQSCLCEPKGRVAYRASPMQWLIERAYNLQTPQVQGPDWLGDESFNIDAKLPEGASMQDIPAMLRALLAERFQLSAHTVRKEIPALVLAVRPGGSTLAPPKEGWEWSWRADKAGIHLRQKMSTSELAYYLAGQLQRPVVDETALDGTFAITLDFAPERTSSPPAGRPQEISPLPQLTTAVQEQLGLKLESARRVLPVLIIDHIAKTPSGN